MPASDRREHTRFALQPMYTRVLARPEGRDHFDLDGHAYDLSLGGMRFELDTPIAPGTLVSLLLELPDPLVDGEMPTSSLVAVRGTVIWQDDDDAPGPVRMAAVFHAFDSPADEARLRASLDTGRYARAA